MAYGGFDKYMDAAAELGRNPVLNKHQIEPEFGDEQADAGRDCRARPRDQILRHERGQRNIHFSFSADHEEDWQPAHPVDPYSCYMCCQTYTHTYVPLSFSLRIESTLHVLSSPSEWCFPTL